MAVFSGHNGLVTSPGYALHVHNWRINYQRDKFDVTQFATPTPPTARSWIGGIKQWSGTYEAFVDDAVGISEASLEAGPGAAVFTGKTGVTYTGSILVEGYDITVDINDVAKVTVTFQGDGDLTIAP